MENAWIWFKIWNTLNAWERTHLLLKTCKKKGDAPFLGCNIFSQVPQLPTIHCDVATLSSHMWKRQNIFKQEKPVPGFYTSKQGLFFLRSLQTCRKMKALFNAASYLIRGRISCCVHISYFDFYRMRSNSIIMSSGFVKIIFSKFGWNCFCSSWLHCCWETLSWKWRGADEMNIVGKCKM